MMTSQADVKQMGVVIRQTAERGMCTWCVCVCVFLLGQGENMQCPLGFSAVRVLDGHSLLRLYWSRIRLRKRSRRKWRGRRRKEERLAGRKRAQMIDLEVETIMETKRLKSFSHIH